MRRRKNRHPLADPLADPALLDLIPCKMRLSRATPSTPVPTGHPKPKPNSDILVWCECMAETLDQRLWALRGAEGQAPQVRGPRPCDYLGIVSVSEGFDAARRVFLDHKEKRSEGGGRHSDVV